MILELIPLAIFDASQFFQWFTEHANYMFVFLFMVIESSFVPFPSEVVVPPAAYLACRNVGVGADMNICVVVLMATLGALVGAYINYFLSLWVGRPVVYKFAGTKFAHACSITPEKVEKAERYFDRHGALSTLIGRLIPVIRQLISIPAGLSKMNFGIFSLFTFLGALIWNILLGLVGWILAQTVDPANLFEKVEEYNRYLTWGGYALLAMCVVYILWNAFRHNAHKADSAVPENQYKDNI